MTSPDPEAREPAEEPLLDLGQARDYLGFVRGSLLRRRWLAAAVLGSILATAALALVALPKTYHSDAKIQAQRNLVMATLGNPARPVPEDADAPTRAASDTVLRRESLLAIVRQTDLLRRWEATRSPLLHLKDRVFAVMRGELSEEDQRDMLVGLLAKRLKVSTGDGSVTIAVDWTDAQTAYQLVEAAQQSFLESRHAQELAIISEAVSILEWHSENMRDQVQAAFDQLRKVFDASQRVADSRQANSAPTPRRIWMPSMTPGDPEQARLEVLLSAKHRAIQDLEEFRRRRTAELQAQLAEQAAVYAPAHPAIRNTRQSIAALSGDSPQLAALRDEESRLRVELQRHGERKVSPGGSEPGTALALAPQAAVSEALRTSGDLNGDPAVEYARTQLNIVNAKYQDLLNRIDAARIELDTATAAFKYRYSVLTPARLPKDPVKPKPALILGGALAAGLMLALFSAVAVDLSSGKILEAWQVERFLKVKVLAEVEPS